MIRTRVTGGNTLKDELKNLDESIRKDVFETIEAMAFAYIETPAKQNVPVDVGRLKNSITTFTAKKKTFNYTDNQNNSYDGRLKSVNPSGYEVYVGTNVEYAEKIHENGGGGPFSGRTVGGQKRSKGYGRYFLKKAYENAIPKIIAEIKRIKGIE